MIKRMITVFTDGSATNNGSTRATGGIGVYFQETTMHKYNVSIETKEALKELIPSYSFINWKVTNNISELTAILKTLKLMEQELKNKTDITIKSDSMYCINSLTLWYIGWKKNGWINSSNKKVLNREIIQEIVDKFILPYKSQITFIKVKAHSIEPPKSSPKYQDFYGNYMADKLATKFLFQNT